MTPEYPVPIEWLVVHPATQPAHVLYRPCESGPPAARQAQPVAGVLRRVDRPVVALRAVQLAQKEVELLRSLGEPAEEVLRRVEPVVDEHLAAVTAGVVARQKNRIGVERGAGLQVVVERLDERQRGGAVLEREVRVQQLGVGWDITRELRRGA